MDIRGRIQRSSVQNGVERGGGDCNARKKTQFNKVISHLGLIDLPVLGRSFT